MPRKRSWFQAAVFSLLIATGVVVMLYPFFTEIRAWRYQQQALAVIESGTEQSVVLPAEDPPETQLPVSTKALPTLPAVFVIDIPRINVKAVVARGTTPYVLSRGPGWYENTAMPGEGNTAVAAHRNMYGSWFKDLEDLTQGDRVTIDCGEETYIYAVEYTRIVCADDWSVLDETDAPALTLTTCHKSGKANRLIVRAEMIDIQ